MSHFFAFVLGVVEGFTEYLPVSSTGHLVLVSHLLGENGEGAKAFDIVIQLGAILAVVVHYRALLLERASGLFSRDPRAIALAVALAVGFLPAAVTGFLLRKTIKEHLFGPLPVALALLVGGVVMIGIERHRRARSMQGLEGLEHVTPRRALLIGIGQCFSLWPGASRSMCTIVAGQLTGLSTATAAEFSFLLALPTLTAATLYEGLKSRHELLAAGAGVDLAIGLVVSFLVAWAVIAGFLAYLKHRGLEPFGYYRIVLAALVFFLVLR
ncbi:MAG TPA: undecaprenyl-diphosphate phosphatase [Polyangiaceae bacterium]|nr:undecaprenyl-diphosphate phosphatase [Polyangiaceae bacterium]